MRKRIEDLGIDMDCLNAGERWGVLQENLAKNLEANELNQEKIWVKEGECEECGAFDVLSRFDDKFICAECSKLQKNKKTTGKNKN